MISDGTPPVTHETSLTIREHVALGPYTTLGLGGPARYFVACRNDEEIAASLRYAARNGLRIAVLGGGSNSIIADEGFDGLVLHIETRGIVPVDSPGSDTFAVAAGEPWDDVVRFAIAQGLSGIECLSGIPGSTGATPIQNVGAYGQEVSTTIASVDVLDIRSLEPRRLTNGECCFGYRTSMFKDTDAGRFIVTSVTFRLSREGVPGIAYAELARTIERQRGGGPLPRGVEGLTIVRDAVLALRRSKSMVIDPSDPNSRSVGSFFTNPVVSTDAAQRLRSRWPDMPQFPVGDSVKLSAAWLVEHAGFPKGYREGGAAISDHHALALVNRGTTAHDLLALATKIQTRVQNEFSIRLEREPVILT